MSATSASESKKEETNIVDTVQSLIVAFALAMAVRSFVTEGFVIPTGSMGPTLMGQHVRLKSTVSGDEFPIDSGPAFEMYRYFGDQVVRQARPIMDPMLSHERAIGGLENGQIMQSSRMGDRVLVLKFLYPFHEPARWDVVVFKNPTDPVGDSQNYIKRLVGLPNEQFVIVDGDVFTAPLGATDPSAFTIQRKPEFVQTAVWRTVYDSDFVPIDPAALAKVWNRPWSGVPFQSVAKDQVQFAQGNARAWSKPIGHATLEWNHEVLPIDDWAAYNMWRDRLPGPYAMSDIRLRAALDCSDPVALRTSLTISARKRNFVFTLGDATLTLSILVSESGEVESKQEFPFKAPAAGTPFDLECVHVDQTLEVLVNGESIGRMEYSFPSLDARLEASFPGRTTADFLRNPMGVSAPPTALRWEFDGAALTLRSVAVDRDLFYRSVALAPREQGALATDLRDGLGFACDPTNPAQLNEGQFLMLGDNSAASRDGRLWGAAHELVGLRFGEAAPFVVPRELLLGKAWSVYFPAPVSPGFGMPAIVPDFGRLRFIR